MRPVEVLQSPGVRIYAENWGLASDVGVVAQVGNTDAGACWMRLLPVGTGLASVDATTPQLGTGLRLVALERGVPISANRLGKAKTTSQVVAVSLLIFSLRFPVWAPLATVALWVAIALTVISMVVYFWQNRHVVAPTEAGE